MDHGALRTLALDVSFGVHGVSVTVTRPSEAPIATAGIWLQPLEDQRPFGTDLQRREPRRLMALRRDAVASLPRGTLVSAPETDGGSTKTWRVDEIEQAVDPQTWRIALVQAPERP